MQMEYGIQLGNLPWKQLTLEATKSPLFPLRKLARFPYLQNSTMTIKGPAKSTAHSHLSRNDDEGLLILGIDLSW